MITVRFFGTMATMAGRARLEIAYREGMSLQDVYEQLQPLYPEAFALASVAAVNGMEFRDMSLPLDDGWDVVFMPGLFGI